MGISVFPVPSATPSTAETWVQIADNIAPATTAGIDLTNLGQYKALKIRWLMRTASSPGTLSHFTYWKANNGDAKWNAYGSNFTNTAEYGYTNWDATEWGLGEIYNNQHTYGILEINNTNESKNPTFTFGWQRGQDNSANFYFKGQGFLNVPTGVITRLQFLNNQAAGFNITGDLSLYSAWGRTA